MNAEQLIQQRREERRESIDKRNLHLREASKKAVKVRQERQLALRLSRPPKMKRIYTMKDEEFPHKRPLREIQADLRTMLSEQLSAQRKRWGLK